MASYQGTCKNNNFSVNHQGHEGAKVELPDDNPIVLHPLLMDDILDKLFQFIVIKVSDLQNCGYEAADDVQSCRLVCEKWRERVTSLYRRIGPRLTWDFRSTEKSNGESLHQYLNVMKDSNMIPCVRYLIFMDHPRIPQETGSCGKAESRMLKFLKVCGPSVTELQLDVDDELQTHFELILHPRLSLPNLTHLDIKYVLPPRYPDGYFTGRRLHYPVKRPNLPYWLKLLLISADTLENLSFHIRSCGIGSKARKEHRIMGQVLQIIPSTVTVLDVSQSVLTSTLTSLHIHYLTKKKLALKTLKLSNNPSCSNEALVKFFEQQSTTLKSLHLSGNSCSTFCPGFPPMEKLSSLFINGEGNFGAVSIRDAFPSLSSLQLRGHIQGLVNSEGAPCQKKVVTVKELTYDFVNASRKSQRKSEHKIIRGLECFPNIKCLKICLSLDKGEELILQQIFKYVTNIEELQVNIPWWKIKGVKGFGDFLLSGVPPEDCDRITEAGNFTFSDSEVEEMRRYPSIRNLSKLRKLSLMANNGVTANVNFTDFSVYYIFLKMVSLESLLVSRLNISSTALKLLKSHLKVLGAREMIVERGQ